MLKKFLHGVVFGAGFGVSFVAVWLVGIIYIFPRAFETALKEPDFTDPQPAKIVKPDPTEGLESPRDFSFYKHSESRMEIPENGGILSMTLISTPKRAKRPSTYQLWMTHSELWQIRTSEEDAEIEKLPYPEDASIESLDSLMQANVGITSGRFSMTVTQAEIRNIKSGDESISNRSLNGELKMTNEGVVFAIPDPYET